MLSVEQRVDTCESKPLTNNDRQDDEDSLKEEAGIIYNKLEQELMVTDRTEEQLLHTGWWWHIRKSKKFYIILLVFVTISTSGVALASHYRQHNRDEISVTSQVKSGYLNKNDDSDEYDSDEYSSRRPARMNSQGYRTRMNQQSYYRVDPPEEMGYFNIYIREPTADGYPRPSHRVRFPAARYSRHRFPLVGPFMNFRLAMPIFVDPSTGQTIIHSPRGSIYVLPPLINVYAKIFSVGELIVSGYASFINTGIGMTNIADFATFFRRVPLMGPDIPRINSIKGGFMGGMRTRYHSFFPSKFSKTSTYDADPDYESHDEDNYQSPPYSRNKYYKKPSRSSIKVDTSVTTGITRIVINPSTNAIAPSESPTFGGKIFGSVGAYEKLRGTAYGQLDPNDARNSIITDLKLAPRNEAGMVNYSMDFYILKPISVSNGNHKLFFEVNNRGGKQFGTFDQSSGGNNPTTVNDAGQAFLMSQGYTIAWCGWDPSVATTGSPDLLRIYLPIATNADGSSITGLDYEYIVFDNPTTTSYTTSYNTNSIDTSKAKLTVKDHLTDLPVTIPSTDWMWTSNNTISLLPANTAFKQSSIYELVYTAKDPYVAGIGFAATRDFVSFLRSTKTNNPLKGDITRAVSWSLSQPGRYMNDFVWLGFNQDLLEKRVFDGVFNWVSAGNGIGLNYRFAQSGRTERNRQNHLYPEAPFPFSYATLTDPFTGKTDGRNVQCMKTSTCPKIMNIISANEYWVKAGSLLHSDLEGNDLVDPSNVRNYLLAGTQHGGPSLANSFGICQQFGNTIDPNPALRALFVALDQWLDGTKPPASRVPRRSDETAVSSDTTVHSPLGIGTVSQALLNWPTIPNVLYTGLVTVRNHFNFGPQFDKGIISIDPPHSTGKYYPSFVSKVDIDGNELAGIRLPPVAAPFATNAGWNLRNAAHGGNDGCESTGSLIPFAPDMATRIAKGDMRLSLTERYGDHTGYVAAVTSAANILANQRLLLPADVQAYISAAQLSIKVIDNPTYGSYTW